MSPAWAAQQDETKKQKEGAEGVRVANSSRLHVISLKMLEGNKFTWNSQCKFPSWLQEKLNQNVPTVVRGWGHRSGADHVLRASLLSTKKKSSAVGEDEPVAQERRPWAAATGSKCTQGGKQLSRSPLGSSISDTPTRFLLVTSSENPRVLPLETL